MSLLINTARSFLRHPHYICHLLGFKLRMWRRYRWIARHPESCAAVPPPLICKFLLTYRCNARCTMCMQWGNAGWCKDTLPTDSNSELAWELLQSVITQLAPQRPDFVFSGGEPFLYTHAAELIQTLKQHRLYATFCTNGLLLDKFAPILQQNRFIVPLVSLDGFAAQNDLLRGKGHFEKVTENLRLLKSARRPPYIGIQFTIQPENVAVMFDFCQAMVALGVDWILLNPGWFITEPQARAYEKKLGQLFGLTPKTHLGYLAPYALDRDEYIRQLRLIRHHKWPIQISSYLKRPEDIAAYLDAPDRPIQNSSCHKQWIRMDVTPAGEVCPCIQFPDVVCGDLRHHSAADIWNSPEYARFRAAIREQLLPVCPKCNCLYLYDAGRQASLSK